MKVFISWSGERSQKVAELLSSWLKCVLQASKPWVSSDMDRGIDWFNTINQALADTTTGIVCLTAENLNAPWILFEAGSISNGLTDKRVCTFLIDINPADVKPPLSQFNHTEPNETSMLNLVRTVNERLGDKKLETETLKIVFNTYYAQFEEKFKKIILETKNSKGSVHKSEIIRSEQEMLEEVLLTVRNLNQRVRKIERTPTVKKQRFVDDFEERHSDRIINIEELLSKHKRSLIHAEKYGDTDALDFIVEKVIEENGLTLPISFVRELALKYLENLTEQED